MTAALLRDVLQIPERRLSDSDFVLKLSDGVEHVDTTVADYVVTPALADAFDRALGFVETAVVSGRSQAAFIHGSFGSGKSHFLAVLHALLGGNPRARSLENLSAVVAKHDPSLQGRKILRLTYHLIGATSLESAIFGGYLAQVNRLHPEAAMPELHRSDRLLLDAAAMRARDGDEKFFAGLGGGGSGVWDRFAGRWDATSYDAAAAAPPGDPERGRLVDALVRAYFSAFAESTDYVDLDNGLRILATHAKDLGYDAVVLFLDELVLWLASRLGNADFVANEGAKVAKLVESADARRPIPLVSFLARQRDLRDFLGEAAPGAQQAAIADTFRWWEDRFDRIVLGDENLPYIAARRVLRLREPAAQSRATLDAAFARIDRRPEIWNTLLDSAGADDRHRGADQAAFRLTYPFSPALVSTVRAVSGLMQRERTALKVMQQMLVDQRNDLTVDDVVPVGDVFDSVVQGQTALDVEMERHFAAARRLYAERLRPLLLAEHGLDEESAATVGPRHPFRTDDRLAKTLLLSALVPGVPALRDLDGPRLAALNHGTIATPLPGEEGSTVLGKVRAWQPSVPEIQLSGDSTNPTITVRLADVDYQSVLDKVRYVDSLGARRRLLRGLVWDSLGIRNDDTLGGVQDHPVVWRASKRTVEVVYGNVRSASDLTDDVLVHEGSNWRIAIDYPFDEEGFTSRDDAARLEGLLTAGSSARTVAWIPRFFTADRLEDVGRLVILEHLLGGTGERFDANADHLSVTDRTQARAILENLRVSTRERLRGVISQAYGAAAPQPGDVDLTSGHEQVLWSLDPSFSPRDPVGATLEAALGNLADQMLRHAYPAHPDFLPATPDLRAADLRKVLVSVEKAHEQPQGRVTVTDATDRTVMRRVVEPLGLGSYREGVYVLDPASNFPWRNRFTQAMAREGIDGPVPVRRLRAWADADAPRGLDRLTANLVIATWAIVTDRSWELNGGPVVPAPALEAIRDEMTLREQRLPSRAEWEPAVRRGGLVFGVVGSPHVTAANVRTFAATIRQRTSGLTSPAAELVRLLEAHASALGLDTGAATGRLATAWAGVRLPTDLAAAGDDIALIGVLAGFRGVEDAILGRSLARAAEVVAALSGVQWELLSAAEQREPGALAALHRAAAAEELAAPLPEALRTAERDAVRIITPPPSPPPSPPPPPPPSADGEWLGSTAEIDQVLDPLIAFAEKQPGRRVRVTWRLEP
jgi:hypothetical protein